MINWYEMYTLGRVEHAERVFAAEQKRLFARRATSTSSVPIRSQIGQTLISIGRWVDGRSDAPTYYDVERKGAR